MTERGTNAYNQLTDLPPPVARAVRAAADAGFAFSCRPEQGRLLHALAGGATDGIGETGTGCGVGLGLAAGGVFLLAATPALVGAALVSSYRGQVPAHVMIGVETPAGNTGPFQAALWYGRGPLVTLALLAPAAGLPLWGAVPWLLAVAAGTAWWVRRTVRSAIS